MFPKTEPAPCERFIGHEIGLGARSPSFDEVEEASNHLMGQIVATPLVENHDLNRVVGGRLLIKAETLQQTSSIKFRGTYKAH